VKVLKWLTVVGVPPVVALFLLVVLSMIIMTTAAMARIINTIMKIMNGFLCYHNISNLSLQSNPIALGAYMFLLFILN
jgi:hypothetical protein